MTLLLQFASYLFAVLALGGLAYLLLSLWSQRLFLRRRGERANAPAQEAVTPPVSILKPLRGTDREMHESLRSHCLQDYPRYEILFGVSRADDEAVAEVERLQREFPTLELRLIVCGPSRGANAKVSSLAHLMREAKYDHILVNDSDIRVETDYLRRVFSAMDSSMKGEPMRHKPVGLVTCLYRAEAGRSLASRVEAVTIATDFAGGVLCAVALEGGLHFGLGSTLAFPRRAAEAIGGLDALLDYLADDHELGRMIAEAGYGVELSEVVVETFLPDYGWRLMFEHQLRWARTVRDLRKWGYVGALFTFALPWAMAAALCARGAAWSLLLLAAVAAARFASGATLCGPILHDRRTMRDLWLIPLRDIVGIAIWFWSFAGDTIVWRGERFHLKDGKLTRA